MEFAYCVIFVLLSIFWNLGGGMFYCAASKGYPQNYLKTINLWRLTVFALSGPLVWYLVARDFCIFENAWKNSNKFVQNVFEGKL